MTNRMQIRVPEFRPGPSVEVPAGDAARLARFIDAHRRVLVVSGAGCSTASGIPAYRNGDGRWTSSRPISYQEFVNDPAMRRRYWARSYLGWPRILAAKPNGAHLALARLERSGRLAGVITQNVDGLHRRAGSREVVELHGGLSHAVCLGCSRRLARSRLQHELAALNPQWRAEVAAIRPDGDAVLADGAWNDFRVPDCPRCTGTIKPDVVFFGERVPVSRVAAAWRLLDGCNALLVLGSSLVVFSAYRFLVEAARRGLPIAAVNQGRTRADELLQFKIEEPCDRVLSEVEPLLMAGPDDS